MRRAETNAGSQPVRNYWPTPGFETASGNGAIRTNLCAYPGGETSSSQVTPRTNLVINPALATDATGWTTYGGSSTHPDLITSRAAAAWATSGWAWRVEGKATSTPVMAEIGIGTYAVTAGQSVAASVSVIAGATRKARIRFRFTGGPGGDYLSSDFTLNAVTPTRMAFSMTVPTGVTSLSVNIKEAVVPDTFLAGDWIAGSMALVEVAAGLMPYFDGSTAAAGDFTYGWTGTANASTSTQRATGIAGWQGSSLGYPFQSSITSYAGTKCVAVMTKGGNGDGAYTLDITTVPGTTYTFSSWIKVTETVPNFTANMRWKDAANTTLSDLTTNLVSSLVVGQWTRLSYTTTAPTNAVKLQAMWRIFAAHTPTTFYVDSTLIEAHPALLGYFDGSTAAAGDFTYNWTGTANASTSEQRGLGLPGVTAGNSGVLQSSEWSATGSKSLKIIPNTQFNTSSAIMLSGVQLARGKTYTAIATRRLTAPLTGTLSTYAGAIILVHTGVGTFLSPAISNVAGVSVAKLKFFLADNGQSWTLRLGHGGAAGSGDVWWDNFMVVEGDYEGGFIDPGTTPFSKWDGTAHNSTSVGYPPSA